MIKTILETKHLQKVIQDSNGLIEILKEVNLKVESHSTVAITGSSGSGKSTLLGLLAGLDVPSSGEIILDGHQISSMSEDERAKIRAQYISFVFQNYQLLPNMTALENVMLPLELKGLSATKQAKYFLSEVGLKDRLNAYPKTLSGGEQQRVALARAFVVQPKILFADEPTGSLDSQTGSKIAKLMFNLQQESKSTLILVTHDTKLASLCDKQYLLKNGTLSI